MSMSLNPRNGGARRILVVDDEKFSRSIILRILKDILPEHEVVQAADGGEALNHLRGGSDAFALVICDFNMPVLTGLHFLKAVRTGFEGIRHDLPVVMLTGHADSALVQAALALDVDGFLVKPVSKQALQTRLEYVLGGGAGLKTADQYGNVDIEDISQAVLKGTAPVVDVQPRTAAAGRPVGLAKLELPATLAADVVAPTGEVLVRTHLVSTSTSGVR